MFSDSQSVIHLVKNHIFHVITKHINIIYHFICSILEDKEKSLEKIHLSMNLTDVLIKVINSNKMKFCIYLIDLHGLV